MFLNNVIRSKLYDLGVSGFLCDIRKELKKLEADGTIVILAEPDELEAFKQKQLYKLVILVCRILGIRVTFITESMKPKGEKKQ